MSSSSKHSHPKTWELTGSWAGAWKVFAVVGIVGIAGAGFGYTQDVRRFAFSWLFGFITVLTVALGALFFVLVQRLTSAGWSVTVRRTAEFFALGLTAMVPLFFPVLLCMNQLFPWLNHHGAEEHGEHAAPAEHGGLSIITPAYAQTPPPPAPAPTTEGQGGGHGMGTGEGHGRNDPRGAGEHEGHQGNKAPPAEHGPAPGHTGPRHPGPHLGANQRAAGLQDPHELIEEDILAKKAGYLNRNFFLVRAGLYFLIWIFLATRLFGYSTSQDTTKDPKLTVAAQKFSYPALIAFALSLTFAAFDWIMSLEPTWFSTIFGVVIFAGATVSSYAVIILVTMALKNAGPLEGAVTVEHYHDLGKLMWGFLIFWGYVSFSQFMLIWYAALPEETTFFHNRWDYGPWRDVSTAIIFGHFVLPFFWLISRNFKRNLGRLQIGALIILVMHVIDMYWYVMPNFHLGKEGFSFHWMDIACLFACAGVYGAFVFHRMTKHPLVPIGDPRLERSLHFQNA